jgi:hypothetical protein
LIHKERGESWAANAAEMDLSSDTLRHRMLKTSPIPSDATVAKVAAWVEKHGHLSPPVSFEGPATVKSQADKVSGPARFRQVDRGNAPEIIGGNPPLIGNLSNVPHGRKPKAEDSVTEPSAKGNLARRRQFGARVMVR